jgi:hypothetical protein
MRSSEQIGRVHLSFSQDHASIADRLGETGGVPALGQW